MRRNPRFASPSRLSNGRSSSLGQKYPRLQIHHRRLLCEVLEDRRLLSIDLPSTLWQTIKQQDTLELPAQLDAHQSPSYTLDIVTTRSLLTQISANVPASIAIPKPDGNFSKFAVHPSSVMAPAIAAKFTEIRTYAGQGIDDPSATIRFDITPAGFHAQVISSNGSYNIDPVPTSGCETYLIREWEDIPAEAINGVTDECTITLDTVRSFSSDVQIDEVLAPLALQSRTGGQLRTYRLAMAATGEWTDAYGNGTVAGGLAAITTIVNRINGVYENELAIHFQLVANNDQLVFTDGATDPYTNSDNNAMLDQNQTRIDETIGDGNYDIGHVLGTAGGGISNLAVVGVPSSKAHGVSGEANPSGMPSTPMHEIGHQFGALHTWSSDDFKPEQFNASSAMEPGSGSTIMSYGDRGSADSLQTRIDPYFHSASFDSIIQYVDVMHPTIGTRMATGNTPPTVEAGNNHTIPARTAFSLTATGSDPDGDTVTYCWEQRDAALEPYDLDTGDNGNIPLFRSWPPTTDTMRVFPRLTDLLANTTTKGEILPTVTRGLHFRVTARDNHSGGGGVSTDDVVIDVIDTGTAFAITCPNTRTIFPGGTSQTVTWDVAGTDGGAINTANVDILLSTDGGHTFPYLLAESAPNSGIAQVTIPNLPTTTARIKVAAVENVFFDISDTNFTILTTADLTTNLADGVAVVNSTIRPGQLCEDYVFTGRAGDLLTVQIHGGTPWDQFDSALALFSPGQTPVYVRLDTTTNEFLRYTSRGEQFPFDPVITVLLTENGTYAIQAQADATALGTMAAGPYTLTATLVHRAPAPQTFYLDFSQFTTDAIAEHFGNWGDPTSIRETVIEAALSRFRKIYASYNVTASTDKPSGAYSPLRFVHSDTSEDILGSAFHVDWGNSDPSDPAEIYFDKFPSCPFPVENRISTREDLGILLGTVAAHEAGHLLGLNHVDATQPDEDLMGRYPGGQSGSILQPVGFGIYDLYENSTDSLYVTGKRDAISILSNTVGLRTPAEAPGFWVTASVLPDPHILSPNSEILVSGMARYHNNGHDLPTGTVRIFFAGQIWNTVISNGTYKTVIRIPSSAKSSDLVVEVTDANKLVGIASVHLTITVEQPVQVGSDLSIASLSQWQDDYTDPSDWDTIVEGYEGARLGVELKNNGNQPITNVMGLLMFVPSTVTISKDSASYIDLAPQATTAHSESYQVYLNLAGGEDTSVPFVLQVSYTKGGIRYFQNFNVSMPVKPQQDYGTFEVGGYPWEIIDDSPTYSTHNNGDHAIQSGERIRLTPSLSYWPNPIAPTATGIRLQLTSSDMTVNFDTFYPNLAPEQHAQPVGDDYIELRPDKSFAGTAFFDATITWDQRSTPLVIKNALQLIVAPVPRLALNEHKWDFGLSPPGLPITRTLTVSNAGSAPLHILNITTNATDTTVAGDTAFDLSPGESRQVPITITTDNMPGGTQLSGTNARVISFESDSAPEDPAVQCLQITGLVSNEYPHWSVSDSGSGCDISGNWIVYKHETIILDNVVTHEQRVIPDTSAATKPMIGGDLVVWEDVNSAGQKEIRGMSLTSGVIRVISSNPASKLAGVDGGYVAFTQPWMQINRGYPTTVTMQDLYGLWLYNWSDGSQISVRNWTPGPSYNYWAPTIDPEKVDFGGGCLAWREYWWHLTGGWAQDEDCADQLWTMRVGGTSQMIEGSFFRSTSHPTYQHLAVNGDLVAWSAVGGYSATQQVWLWEGGGRRQITFSDRVVGEQTLAIGNRLIAYDVALDSLPRALCYQNVDTVAPGYGTIISSHVTDAEKARMDGNGLVWRGNDAVDGHHILASALGWPDLSITKLSVNNEHPYEGDPVTVSVEVTNQSSYESSDGVGFVGPTVLSAECSCGVGAVCTGDFDGDGKSDMAIARGDNTIGVFFGDGFGGFEYQGTYLPGGSGCYGSLIAGDFNGDGKSDLAAANSASNTIGVLLSDGTGGFDLARTFSSGGVWPTSLALGDFNNDGKSDLAVANANDDTVGILVGNGNGGFAPAVTLSSGGDCPKFVVAGDLNDDGKIDLAVMNGYSAQVAIFLGNGTGNFGLAGTYSAGRDPVALAMGDFNGDGKEDLAAPQYDDYVAILLGTGTGGFSSPSTFSTGGSQPRWLIANDLNMDGRDDLVVANVGVNNVGILLANSSGGFASPTVYSSGGAGPQYIAEGDFNGDGKSDFAVSNCDSSAVGLLLSRGILLGLYDGDPDAPGTHLLQERVLASKLLPGERITASFAPVTLPVNSNSEAEQIRDLYIRMTVFDGNNQRFDYSANNTSRTTITVVDKYTRGPMVLGAFAEEYNGDSGGTIATDESVKISWMVADPSGIASVQLLLDGSPVGSIQGLSSENPVLAECWGVLPPLSEGLHNFSISATNNDISPATSTYTVSASVIAPNAPPVLTVDQSSLAIGEGHMAWNTGTWSDVLTDRPYVSLSASIGEVVKHDDGTWSWSYTPADDVGEPSTVIITADDGQPVNHASNLSFSLMVNNLAPSLAVDQTSVIVGEGQEVTNTGIWIDVLSDRPNITLAASVGTVTKNADGTWSWSYTAVDDTAQPSTVTITADDGEPGGTSSITFSLTVNNLPPILTVDHRSATTGEGHSVTNSGTWSDVAADVNPDTLRFSPELVFSSGGNGPQPITVGDFNGDGQIDLVAANTYGGSVGVLLGNGNGGFSPVRLFPVGGGPEGVTTGDFNGDGKLDIATANTWDRSISVLLGDGQGGFSGPVNFPCSGRNPSWVAVGDFNADGKSDLAVSTWYGGVDILVGNGGGSFTFASSVSVGGNNHLGVAIGDFNGDGKSDLAIPNYSDGTVGVLLGNGTGSFSTGSVISTSANPATVRVSDLNADGKQDLMVTPYGGNTVDVLLGDGRGGFAPARTFSSGGIGLNDAIAADFDGDGMVDLAVTNNGSRTVCVLLGDGAGSFAAPQAFSCGGIPYYLVASDFNADGKSDLALASGVATAIGSVRVLLNMSGPTPALTASVGTVTKNEDGSWEWSYTPGDDVGQPSTVTITADDGEPNGAGSITFNLTVNNLPPVAEAGGAYICDDLGLNVALDASASHDPGNDIVSYGWDLDNDGQYDDATGVTATYYATAAGTFSIGLRVTDSGGANSTDTATITVYDNRPFAVISTNPDLAAPTQTIAFDANCSSHGRPDHTIVNYEWDFDYNGTFDTDTTGIVANHSYNHFGTFTVALRVTDNNVPARSDTTTRVVKVNQGNQPPLANPGGQYLIGLGTGIQLDASASFDPNSSWGDTIKRYEWDLDNNGIYEFSTNSPILSEPPELTSSIGVGFRTIGLRVTDTLDATGTASTTLDIRGGNIPGTGDNESVRIAVNGTDVSKADVFYGESSTTPAYAVALPSQWQVDLGGGDDQLIVDFSNGSPVPGGLDFDGGAGNDTICVVAPAGQDVTVTASQVTVGTVIIPYSRVENFSCDLGAGRLTKTGDGTVVLSGTNNYTGGTTVEAGTLVIGNAGALPSGRSLSIGSGGTLVLGGGLSLGTMSVVSGMAVTSSSTTIQSSANALAEVVEPLDVLEVDQTIPQLSSVPANENADEPLAAIPPSDAANQALALDVVLASTRLMKAADLAWVQTLERFLARTKPVKNNTLECLALDQVLARFGE